MSSRSALPWIVLAASALLFERQDASAFDTAGYPQEMVSAARLAERRCTKCHTIGRVLEAPWEGDEWVEIVREMARKEKSGISDAEAGRIATFLSFRSTRRKGEDATASRPAKPGEATRTGAPSSRPAVFGGSAAYPSPTSSVYASAVVPASAPLPLSLELAGLPVVVHEVSARTDESRVARVKARVAFNGRESDIVLSRDAAGSFSSEVLTIRNWTIGPHPFRLDLAVYQADPSPGSTARSEVVLGLLVVRASSR